MKFQRLDVHKVEKELEELIHRLKIDDQISVQWVKDFTYNFDLPTNQISKKYFGKLMDLIPRDVSEKDFEKAMQVFNDAWNCFPQKIMNGKSPQDKLDEADGVGRDWMKDMPKAVTEQEKMTEEHFKYATEHLDEYMNWAFEEVLPKYDKYLKNNHVTKHNDRVGVAGIFLEICGQLGFFEINDLLPVFIDDFPNMFLSSVQGPKISKDNIALYLKDFLNFVSVYYPKI